MHKYISMIYSLHNSQTNSLCDNALYWSFSWACFLEVTLTRLSSFLSKEQGQIYQKISCWISSLWSRWHISLVSEAMILKFLALLYVWSCLRPRSFFCACSQKKTDGRLQLRYFIYKGINCKSLSKVWGVRARTITWTVPPP